jgi:hypothetical protein
VLAVLTFIPSKYFNSLTELSSCAQFFGHNNPISYIHYPSVNHSFTLLFTKFYIPSKNMKFSTLLTATFGAVAIAAPTAPESGVTALTERKTVDFGQLNNLLFKQTDFNYLLNINSLDLTLFQQLGRNNNLNVLLFQDLFNVNSFNLNSLLQFQQLQTLLAIAGTGALNSFDLSALALGGLNLGLVSGIGGVDLRQFISAGSIPQIETIAKQGKIYLRALIYCGRLLTFVCI